jgi:hypothetical protein
MMNPAAVILLSFSCVALLYVLFSTQQYKMYLSSCTIY